MKGLSNHIEVKRFFQEERDQKHITKTIMSNMSNLNLKENHTETKMLEDMIIGTKNHLITILMSKE